ERPLLIVQLKQGQKASREDILKFMEGKIAKWWMPDDVAFVEGIPHTATGKILKTALREQFKAYRFPNAAAWGNGATVRRTASTAKEPVAMLAAGFEATHVLTFQKSTAVSSFESPRAIRRSA